MFFDTAETRTPVLKAVVANITEAPQVIEFTLNGETFGEPVTLEVGSGETEITVPLPETCTDRLTLQMDMPEASRLYNIGWSTYYSIDLIEAGVYE